jgi:uncharacterized membrane protein
MLALLFVTLSVLAGWYARRMVLLGPLIAVAVYAALVFADRASTDTPVVALAILAEVGLASGLFARKLTAVAR